MRTYQPVGLRTLACQGCGAEFQANRKDAKWCDACRWAKTHAHNSRPRPERVSREPRGTQQGWKRRCRDCSRVFFTQTRNVLLCSDCQRLSKGQRYEQRAARKCVDCGELVSRKSDRCQACEGKRREAMGLVAGEANPNWKGGRTEHQGYIRVLNPNRSPRYIGEHVLVWEQANGPVPPRWEVHHKNGIKTDNRLVNLFAMSKSDHHSDHHDPWESRIRDLEDEHDRLEARIRELEASRGSEPVKSG